MNSYHDIPLRRARDRVIGVLFGGLPTDLAEQKKGLESVQQAIPYPLLDLPVAYREKVPFESRPVIFVLGGQEDIQYMLCDEGGIPISYSEEAIMGEPVQLTNPDDPRLGEALQLLPGLTIHPEAAADAIDLATPEQRELFKTTWRRLIQFDAPPITEDVTYTILAAKYVDTLPEVGIPGLWTYLHEPVTFRVGIDTVMPTRFIDLQATDKLSTDGRTITIDFDQPALNRHLLCIEILDSQEEVHYQVFEIGPGGSRTKRSGIVIGGSQGPAGDMRLVVDIAGSFQEDTTLVIRAFREEDQRDVDDPLVSADLEGLLQVRVRPNPAVTFNLKKALLSYGASPLITLGGIPTPQSSVRYEIVALPLPLSYTYEQDSAVYRPNGDKHGEKFDAFLAKFKLDIHLQQQLKGVAMPEIGLFNDPLALPLQEDSLLLMRATKKDNGEWLFLDHCKVALVGPDPDGPVLHLDSTDNPLQIFVRNPQRRVGYQLRETNGTELGPTMLPGVDRGVGWEAHGRRFGMRLRNTPSDPPGNPDLSAIFGDLTVAGPGQSKANMFPGNELAFLPFVPDKRKGYEILLIKEYNGLTAVLVRKVKWKDGAWQVV